MNTLKIKIENFLSKYCIYIFAIITLLIFLSHTPFWDETHAFEIARLKLSQIFYLTRIEGHPILWYLILKPFSSLKLYPYSMWIINWLFSVGAIYVLWKKAPFSPLIKTFITFSVPIVWIYTPIARCYTIGILLLFLICANYEKRFEKPILYSFLIVLASNTSILATIGSFYLGLIYFFEIIAKTIKSSFSKKNFLLVFLIFLLCSFLFLVQFASTRQPDLLFAEQFFRSVMNFTLLPVNIKIFPAILRIFGMITIYYFIFLGFKNDKKGLFFISATYLTLTYLFLNIYSGSQWNHCFYFIYFIIFMWIFGKNFLTNKFSKFLFFIILFLFMFLNQEKLI